LAQAILAESLAEECLVSKMTTMIVSWALALALNMLNGVVGYPAIGPYMPVSDVHEHKQISDEVKAFNDALAGDSPNYARAKFIYMYGAGVSCKSATQPRMLQGFARKDLTGETFYDAFRLDNYEQANFWDTFMLQALDGTGTFAGLDRFKRVTSLKKGVLGLVTLYASHELESAIVKAANGGTDRSDTTSAHAWDEGWAFYYGADSAGANSPWEVAKKRDGDYIGADVSTTIDEQFNEGLIAVRSSTYSAAQATASRDTIYTMWSVTYLRAALKYLQLAETTYDAKAHAEGYAYYMAIDGWIYSKNKAAAEKLRRKLAITQTSIPSGSYCDAKRTLEAAYPAIGISCTIMGEFSGTGAITCSSPCTSPSVTLPAGQVAVSQVAGSSTDITCVPTTTTTTAPASKCILHFVSFWSLVSVAWNVCNA